MAGLRVDIDIKINYSGIRAGEKLFEELFSKDEQLIKTNHEAIMLVKDFNDKDYIHHLINDLFKACNNYEVGESIKLLQQIVPEYKTHIDS
jgi:FlaA1/EpsC-like NDP-sugar epimerase